MRKQHHITCPNAEQIVVYEGLDNEVHNSSMDYGPYMYFEMQSQFLKYAWKGASQP